MDDKGNRVFLNGGDSYAIIRFKIDEYNKVTIPYNKEFGGTEISGLQCSGNGFTASRNDRIKPSYAEIYIYSGKWKRKIGWNLSARWRKICSYIKLKNVEMSFNDYKKIV